ncbi:hypothetical protein T439DRAFT_331998 [Meredithblackwellia eburnea MCA 4105]
MSARPTRKTPPSPLVRQFNQLWLKATTVTFKDLGKSAQTLIFKATRIGRHLRWERLLDEQREGESVQAAERLAELTTEERFQKGIEAARRKIEDREDWNRSFLTGLAHVRWILERADLAEKGNWAQILTVEERNQHYWDLVLFEKSLDLERERSQFVTRLRLLLNPGASYDGDDIEELMQEIQSKFGRFEAWILNRAHLRCDKRVEKVIHDFRKAMTEVNLSALKVDGSQGERIIACSDALGKLQVQLEAFTKLMKYLEQDLKAILPSSEKTHELKELAPKYINIMARLKQQLHFDPDNLPKEDRQRQLLSGLLKLHWPKDEASGLIFKEEVNKVRLYFNQQEACLQGQLQGGGVDDLMSCLSLRQAKRCDRATRRRFAICADQQRQG